MPLRLYLYALIDGSITSQLISRFKGPNGRVIRRVVALIEGVSDSK